jgi:hypothetical protein
MTREEMITHEAIVSAIADTGKGRSRDGYYINALADHENGFKEGFIAGAQWAETHPHWHDVSEKPKEYGVYLTIDKSGWISETWFDQNEWHDTYDDSTVTMYWMPLPALPEGVEPMYLRWEVEEDEEC